MRFKISAVLLAIALAACNIDPNNPDAVHRGTTVSSDPFTGMTAATSPWSGDIGAPYKLTLDTKTGAGLLTFSVHGLEWRHLSDAYVLGDTTRRRLNVISKDVACTAYGVVSCTHTEVVSLALQPSDVSTASKSGMSVSLRGVGYPVQVDIPATFFTGVIAAF